MRNTKILSDTTQTKCIQTLLVDYFYRSLQYVTAQVAVMVGILNLLIAHWFFSLKLTAPTSSHKLRTKHK